MKSKRDLDSENADYLAAVLTTTAKLTAVAVRMVNVLKDGAFSRRRGADAIKCIDGLAALRAEHPELPWPKEDGDAG